MYYGNIKSPDIANGPGCRVSLFVSGCNHHCRGCFNPEAWSFTYGEPFTSKTLEMLLNELKKPYISGITFLGGEPLDKQNRIFVKDIILQIRKNIPEKTIWVYSGFTFEKLISEIKSGDTDLLTIFKNIDTLVDGPFILDKKNISLKFRGSENQRIINIKESMKHHAVIEYKEDEI